MRKYLVGIIIGAALTFSATTYASDITSLIGRAVQGVFPVTIDGDVLPKTAIVIDGTSYLPVRAIGNAIGYDVSFNADLGIELKKKEVTTVSTLSPSTSSPAPTSDSTETIANRTNEIDSVNTQIRLVEQAISIVEMSIKDFPDDQKISEWQAQIKKYQNDIAIWEARKAALQPVPTP